MGRAGDVPDATLQPLYTGEPRGHTSPMAPTRVGGGGAGVSWRPFGLHGPPISVLECMGLQARVVRVEVGGARAHLEVPQAWCYKDRHSGLVASPAQPPPCTGPRGRFRPSPLVLGMGPGGSRGRGGGGCGGSKGRDRRRAKLVVPVTARVAPRSVGTSDPICTCKAKGEDGGHKVCGFGFSPLGWGEQKLCPLFPIPQWGPDAACTLVLWWLKFRRTKRALGGQTAGVMRPICPLVGRY